MSEKPDPIAAMDSMKNPLHLELFREAYNYHRPKEKTWRIKLRNFFQFNRHDLLNIIPILQWLPKYSIKENLLSDVIAGLTVTIMHIPQGLAVAPLGEQPPIVGLYMAIFPTVCYIIFGTSRHLSFGTFAVVCVMVGRIVSDLAIISDDNGPVANSTAVQGDMYSYTPMEVGIAVCLMVGVWQFLLGFLHLGALWVLLSNSLVSGFTTGAATHVIIYQLKYFLGISPKVHSGPLKLIYFLTDVAKVISLTNSATCIISVCSIVVMLILNDYVKPFLLKKYPKCRFPLPSELIVIILALLASYVFDLKNNYNVKIVNYVPSGLPNVVIPPFQLLPLIAVDSLIIALVCVSVTLSLGSIFAKKDGYKIHENQEMMACGLGNIFASFFTCIPVTSSLSRSLIQYTVGGKSQITGLFVVLFMLVFIMFLGPIFEPAPFCVLAAILVVSLKALIMQIKDVPNIYRLSKLDALVWLGTFLGVVILDLDYGLGVGIALSMLNLVLRGQTIRIETLGFVATTTGRPIFLDIEQYDAAQVLPSTLILKIYGNLNFANVESARKKILSFTLNRRVGADELNPPPFVTIVLNLSCLYSIDPTAVNGLKSLLDDLNYGRPVLNYKLILSEVNDNVYDALERCCFFNVFPRNNVVMSTFDAIH